MKVKVSTLLIILLYIIVIGCENCFYLVDASAINVAGVFNYQDIFIILSAIYFILVFIVYQGVKSEYKFKWLIISIVLLSILSSIQSQRLYGQPFFMGLRPQRFWIVWGILYFPVRKMMEAHKLSVDDLIKMVFVIGTCELILYSTQYLVGSDFTFLHVNMGMRYGSERYYFYNIFLRILLFLNLDRIFNKKKIVISSLYIAGVLFVLLVVGKMRMTSLATVLSMLFGVLLWRRGGKTKLWVIFVIGIVGVVLFNTPIVQDTIETILEAGANSYTTRSTLTIRQAGRALYLQGLMNNPVFGCGYISTLNANATAAAGFNDNIYLVDNGLYAFSYIYGGIGIVWLVWFFSTLIKNGWRIRHNSGIQFLLLVPLGWLIAGQTEAHWYFENGFICVTILLAILEEYLRSDKGQQVSKILEREKSL